MFLLFPQGECEIPLFFDRFTFQYVSIISRYLMNYFYINLIFTFQYVSIISCIFETIIMMFAHLHSNMFLLFQSLDIFSCVLVIDLHSNMFLLFRSRVLGKCRKERIYIPICFYYFGDKNIERACCH